MESDHADGLFDAISDAALVVGEDGTVLAGNGHVEPVFGRSGPDLSGRRIGELFVDPSESSTRVSGVGDGCDAGGADGGPGGTETLENGEHGDPDRIEPFSWGTYLEDPHPRSISGGPDLYVRRADESRVPVRLGLTPVERSGTTSIVVTVVDFTREQARNAELHRRSETLASLHEATQDLLKATDREAAAEAAVEYIDDVLGLPIAAVWLHDPDRDVLEPAAWTDAAADLIGAHPTYSPDERSLSWEAFETGEPRYVPDLHEEPGRHSRDTPIRSELIVPLGRYGVLNVGATEPDAIDPDDRTIARLWGASVTMVFVRIERERQLRGREADVIRERDRLEEFASLVSHDLRTPLSVAAGHVELARDEADSEALATASTALDRMDGIISDLLTLAKHGRVVDGREAVSLPTLVDEVRMTVGMDAGQVIVADAVVHADRSRLSQLFENLLGNSLRHAGDDVRVTVGVLDDGIDGDDGDAGSDGDHDGTSDGDHDGTSDGGGFYVADDGPGIDPDRRDRVFEAGVTTADDGTGFGLKIVSEIAEAHGWTVDLGESADGGVRFAFRGVDVDDERSGSDTAS